MHCLPVRQFVQFGHLGVCMDGHLGTSQITSSQPLMLLLAVVVYVLLT